MSMELMPPPPPLLLPISNQLSKNKRRTRIYHNESKHSRKVKITKATFCMYDIVLKRDVRVEISIPGGTHVFAMDEN
jgi:ChAPs (Chs5p-Arf1p-binding proteins)